MILIILITYNLMINKYKNKIFKKILKVLKKIVFKIKKILLCKLNLKIY